MWSRVRHRRLQALSLVALAALLTTSLCLGPLYQRAMEQALAGAALQAASPDQRAVRFTSGERSIADLKSKLPSELDGHVLPPISSSAVPVEVRLPNGDGSVATRLYAVSGACEELTVVDGRCPSAGGEVMVSTGDIELNGWQVGTEVRAVEKVDPFFEGDDPPTGKVTVVGVYELPPDSTWLGAPFVDRAGLAIDELGVVTDDWVTVPDTLSGEAQWYEITDSVVWPLDADSVDVDVLAQIGPALGALQSASLEGTSITLRVETQLPTLAEQVEDGRVQGRVTVTVLVTQLLVLVAVVLWMILAAATDDRRSELALARLRGTRPGWGRPLPARRAPAPVPGGCRPGHRGCPVWS